MLMKIKLLLFNLLIVCVLTVSIPAFSQDEFELTNNGWIYGQKGLQSERFVHDFGYSYFYDPQGSDSIYQNTWWYRTTGDTREYGLSFLTDFTSNGDNSVSLVYEEPGFNGTGEALLRFNLTYTLIGLNINQAYLRTDWSVTNLTSDLLSLDLFNYTDFDVDIDTDDDSAELQAFSQSFGHIKAWDEGSDIILNYTASGDGLSGWEIAQWPETKDSLTDNFISNLSNQSASLGPDELTGAFQYKLSLAGGQTAGGTLLHSLDVVPEPGSFACLVTGLIGLAGIARFRPKRNPPQ